MARTKKYKFIIDGYNVESDDMRFYRELSSIYTLAAIHERSEGHLQTHKKYIDIALSIRAQIGDIYE